MHQYFENNNDLESKLRIIDYDYDTFHMSFFSDLGVFSKDHIDFGSRLLLETYLKLLCIYTTLPNIKFTKGRQRFNKDMREAIKQTILILESVKNLNQVKRICSKRSNL